MQDLRLVGIHENGEHVLLSDQDGQRYRVALDESLRAAVRRERPRGDGTTEGDGGEPMRPREVQALIRAGATVEEVAERAGWSVEKVRRYEPPIRAERDYVAGRARGVQLRGRSATVTLEERVNGRLTERGVELERVAWDAWRVDDTTWSVVCLFPAGGRERRAGWRFAPLDQTLSATDDESRWLGEDEQAGAIAAPAPAVPPRGRGRTTKVYDVEAEGGVAATPTGPATDGGSVDDAPPATDKDADDGTVDLVSAMRERAASRKRRPSRRKTPATDPALTAEELPEQGHPVPQQPEPEPEPEPALDQTPADSVEVPRHDPITGTRDLFEDLEAVAEQRPSAKRPKRRATSEVSTPGVEAAPEPEPDPDSDSEPEPEPEPSATSESEGPAELPARASSTRKGRPSVPSWDDIMFGSRRDED